MKESCLNTGKSGHLERITTAPWVLGWLITILTIQLIGCFIFAWVRTFSIDELEFVHTSWLVSIGKIPHQDFFQHHHLLAHDFSAFLWRIIPQSFEALLIFRILFFLNFIAMGVLTFFIAKKSLDVVGAILACVLVNGAFLFFEHGLTIRPDPIMLTLLLGGVLCFLNGMNERKSLGRLHWSRLSAGWFLSALLLFVLGFLVLQKAIVFLFCFGLTTLWLTWREQLKLIFVIGFFALFFVLSFLLLGVELGVSWRDYFFWNWKLNMAWPRNPKLAWEIPLWILLSGFVVFFAMATLWMRMRKKDLDWLIVFCLCLGASMFLYRQPDRQYFIPLMPFLGILAVSSWSGILKNRIFARALLVLAGVGVIVGTSVYYARPVEQEQRIRYVLEHTDAQDRVFDGYLQGNLFREGVTYFWFSIRPDREAIAAMKRLDPTFEFDPLQAISSQRPKLVFERHLDFYGDSWKKDYQETPIPGLWERR